MSKTTTFALYITMLQVNTMNKKVFQISSVDVEQFATFPLLDPESRRVKIDVNLDLTLNDEKRLINCSFKITIWQLETIIITLQVKCAYTIDADVWSEWVDSKARKTDIPISFVEQISDLTIATARGILFAKTENTKHSAFLVPILDLADYIQPKK